MTPNPSMTEAGIADATLPATTGLGRRLRIVVHDYAGHPFQVQLSRELARRGHSVNHVFFASDVTPRGSLTVGPGDPPGLTIEGIDIAGRFDKFSYWKRFLYEREYGANAAAYINRVAPDIVINSNVPIDALNIIQSRCRAPDRRFVLWLQDIWSVGIRHVLRKKLPVVGEAVAYRYARVERANLAAADRIVSITQDFLPILEGWGVPRSRCSVIENWAPMNEITPMDQDNPWSREQGLVGKTVLLYTGTLGLKHDPAGIAALARHAGPRAEVVVVSQGPGAEWLKAAKAEGGLDNLRIMGFQPYERYSQVLATASVLLAVIEPEAGIFAVPSKVLSYLCAGRALLLSVPLENLAARTASRAGAGIVVAPGDRAGFEAALDRLLADPETCRRMGEAGRAYAERTFEIGGIADRFEAIWAAEPVPARAAA